MTTGKKILIVGMAGGATLIIGYIIYQKYWAPGVSGAASLSSGSSAGSVPASVTTPVTAATASNVFIPGTTVANVAMETGTTPAPIAQTNNLPSLYSIKSAAGQAAFNRLTAAAAAKAGTS